MTNPDREPMKPVTANEIRDAVAKAGIKRIDHHNCGICGVMVCYEIDPSGPSFHSACGCSWSPPGPNRWPDLADWVNMQSDPKWQVEVRRLVGIEVPT